MIVRTSMVRKWISAAFAAALCLVSAPAVAGDCQCDCYFSFDCEVGSTCDYGKLGFAVEDECWWRTPKPESIPGAGCDGNWDIWGRCDGTCIGAAAAGGMFDGESREAVRIGLSTWAAALTDVALKGGGVPTDWRTRIDALEFRNPVVRDVLWRIANDLMVLGRGRDFMIQPKKDSFSLWEVAVDDLRNQPARRRNGELVVQAVLAELHGSGLGYKAIQAIDVTALDDELYGNLCGGVDRKACLYQRVYDAGVTLRSGTTVNGIGGTAPAEADGITQPNCPGCAADIVPNDAIDFADVLDLLTAWGATGFPPADIDQSGEVSFQDLLIMLQAWGPCTL